MCLKCEQLLDINKENKEKRFFSFNYDRVFKSVICDEKVRKNKDFHLLERLISECLEKEVKVLNIIPSELPVQSTNERTKRLDLLVKCENREVHLELNTSFDKATRIRNNCFFFSFYSQHTKRGKTYDLKTEFIHISLNYNMGNKYDYSCELNTNDNKELNLLENILIRHVNLEKFANIWYDNVAKTKLNGSLLTLIGLKEKEEILKYAKNVNDKDVWECVEKLMKLKNNERFVWGLTPEEDELMLQRAREEEISIESYNKGIEKGIEKSTEQTAINMINKNYSLKEINEITGLSIDNLKEIKQKKEC